MLEMVPLAPTPAPTMPSAVASSISTSMESRVLFAPSLPDWKKSGFSLDLAPLLDKLFNGTNRGGIGAGVLVNNMVLKPRLDAADATCYNTTEAPAPIVVPPTFDDDAPDQVSQTKHLLGGRDARACVRGGHACLTLCVRAP